MNPEVAQRGLDGLGRREGAGTGQGAQAPPEPGFAAAYQLMGRMSRLAYDRLGG